MPGVPTSRGCQECRRQKKKCDEAQPVCSRCGRLGIPCVGSGQRRYKFQNKGLSFQRVSPQTPLTNAQTAITGQLVWALEVEDPRFDLSVYGSFFRDIPRRVGSHAALDAAVAAVAVSLPLIARLAAPTAPMLRAYGRALQALRVGLGQHAAALDTLCALYLVVVCQGWMRSAVEVYAGHGEAVAAILDAVKGWLRAETPFERDILSTLCFLVCLESFVNPRIRVDVDLWNLPEPHGPRSLVNQRLAIDSMSCRALAHTAALLRNPLAYPDKLSAALDHVLADRATLAALLATMPVVDTPEGLQTPFPLAARRIHLRWQTAYGILTLVALRISCVLSVPADALVDDILRLAAHASQYRPLGSSAVPFFLLVAFTATEDAVQLDQIRGQMALYRPDMPLEQLAALAAALRPNDVFADMRPACCML